MTNYYMKNREAFRDVLTRQKVYEADYGEFNCGGFALSELTWIKPYYDYDDDGCEWDGGDECNGDCDTCCHYIPDTDQFHNYDYTERKDTFMDAYEDEGYDIAANQVVDLDVEYLCHCYPFLNVVNLDDVNDSDKIIAYRVYFTVDDDVVDDDDFHFRVRLSGQWYEKCGGTEIKVCEFTEDPWKCGDIVYDSKIVYLKDNRA